MASERVISDEFLQQFTGSAAATGITSSLLGVLVLLKRLCDRPSRCKSHLHCPCLDVEVMARQDTALRSSENFGRNGSSPGVTGMGSDHQKLSSQAQNGRSTVDLVRV